jgi:CDP-diacylglycerol---glycerol-3-phosphate 3-phosphatidyltransferase
LSATVPNDPDRLNDGGDSPEGVDRQDTRGAGADEPEGECRDPKRSGPDAPSDHGRASRLRERLNEAPVDHLAEPSQAVSAWNIANAETVFRLLMVPVFVLLLFHGAGQDPVWRAWAFGVFALASVTDRIDGELARRRGLVTDFGKVADPIADKALTGSALVGLSLLGELPWWVTAVVILREAGVTLLRFWVIRHGVIPASRGGKLKTVLQGLAIGLYVLAVEGWVASVAQVLMTVAVVVTVVTGITYVYQALHLRRTSARAQLKRSRRASGGPG